jgi:DNA-binding CsgD family transcriptional regulator
MVHINILFCFLVVTLGSVVFYQGIQTYRVYRHPAVLSFLLYMTSYNLVTTCTLIAQYLYRNVATINREELFVIVGIDMGVVAFTLGGLSECMFAMTVSQLSGRQRMPAWFVYGFGFICSVWLGYFGAGCYRYFHSGDQVFLWGVHSGIILSYVPMDFLIPSFLLFNLGRIQSDRQRKIARVFGLFFVSIACVEICSLFLDASSQFLAFIVLGLTLNMSVLIFFGRMVAAFYGAAVPSPVNELSLDWICAEYHLSVREREIVQRILHGKSNKEIEQELFISSHTVKNHIYHIFQKTGMKSRGQLVSKVVQHSAEPANGRAKPEP